MLIKLKINMTYSEMAKHLKWPNTREQIIDEIKKILEESI